jgi:ribonuclease E
MLMPSHAKRVHQWKEPIPILTKHGAERELGTAFLPTVNLRSGGYIVINQTEALVAIDVNSGRATRERNIEQTALKTNLEAAEEAARQIRLRDLAGLIVIDFIDMEEAKNDRAVEKRMKDCLRFDRARIQMGKISNFGLLELSRQRRRTGILEGSSHVCPHCAGTGRQRSVESSSLSILRSLEESAGKNTGAEIVVRAATDVAFYVLNDKRSWLEQLEQSRGVRVKIQGSPSLAQAEFQIDVSGRSVDEDADLEEEPAQPRRSRSAAPPPPPAREIAYAPDEDEETPAVDTDGEGSGSRRRRGRRGGRRRENGDAPVANGAAPEARREKQDRPPREDAIGEGGGRRRPRRRRGRGRSGLVLDGGEHLDFLATDPIAVALPEPEPEPEPVMEPEHEPEPIVDATPEPVAPPRPSKRAPAAAAAPAPVAAPMAADGDEDDASTPEAADDAGAGVMLDQAQLDSEAYQPDQERRDRFFSRLRPWGKKNV